MTDVSQLDDLALAISSSSPKIKAYARAQAAASQSQELAIAKTISDFGAVGDGITDDTAALTAALQGKTVLSEPGKTYLISQTITAALGQRWSFAGSKIKKSPSMTGNVPALKLSGDNRIENLVLDGNRAGGAKGSGLSAEGTGNVVENCTVENSLKDAFSAQTGDVTFISCTARDVDDGAGTSGSANGFLGANGIMSCVRCRAYGCARAGFATWTDGCYFDGYATRCGYGINIPRGAGDYGHVAHLLCEDNNAHDAFFDGAKGWTIDYLESRNASKTARNKSASGCQMNGCTEFSIGTLVVLAPPGYGLALAGGSSKNRVGTLVVDVTGGWDSDPGLHFSGGACENHIGNAYIRGTSYGVIFAEAVGSNDDNHIGTLTAIENPYGALRIDWGKANRIDAIFARECYTSDPAHPGLLDFSTVNAQDNVVGAIDHRAGATKPKYAVHFDADATGNNVIAGLVRGDFQTAAVLDSNGGNFASVV